MKILKNKAKKALMTAVTMSLVMGVCGSAMAAGAFWYGQSNNEFKSQSDGGMSTATSSGFTGVWDGTLDSSANQIYGGYAREADAVGNEVIIKGGEMSYAYAGYTYTGKAGNNTLIFEGGTSKTQIYGGYTKSEEFNSENNKVTIKDGSFNIIYGGYSYYTDAEKNTVNLLGASAPKMREIYGGYSNTGNARGNTVCIGGYVDDNKNVVTDVKWMIDAPYLTVYGGKAKSSSKESSDNTVKVMSVGNNISRLDMTSIQYLEFYIPATAEKGNTMLTVTRDVNLNGVTVKAGVDGNNKNLKVNDTVNLIVADKAKITNFADATTGKLYVDGFATFGLTIDVQNENVLQAKITESPNKDDDPIDHDATKSPVETRAAVATILNTGADMLSTAGFDNAASAVASEVKAGGSASSMTPFMAMGGTKAKIKSGSQVDVKGWNMNLGLAKEIDNKAGKLLIGPVVEYGRGSYDSYVNDVHGEGDSHFWGAGVMAKQTNDSGFYYEGSLRAGKASSDYQNKAVAGHSYDSDAAYWAAHVGVGKIVKLGDKDNLDYYGKFFYSHQKGDDVTTKSGTDLHFDATKSVRTRLGMRLNHEMDAKNALYAGLAWQREFDGDATATITVLGNNYSTPAPSIKGNTGIMELGWKVNANKNLDLDLGATGYTGKQKGASLNLALNFKF